MYDEAHWMPAQTSAGADIATGRLTEDDAPRAAGGWWLLPCVLGGSMGWFAIISLVI